MLAQFEIPVKFVDANPSSRIIDTSISYINLEYFNIIWLTTVDFCFTIVNECATITECSQRSSIKYSSILLFGGISLAELYIACIIANRNG